MPGFKMRAEDVGLTGLVRLVYYPKRKNRENLLNQVDHVLRPKMGYFVLNAPNSG